MLFNSLAFLSFLVIVLAIYWITAGRTRLAVGLAASCFFYGWWDSRFLALVAVSVAVDFAVGLAIESSASQRRRENAVGR